MSSPPPPPPPLPPAPTLTGLLNGSSSAQTTTGSQVLTSLYINVIIFFATVVLYKVPLSLLPGIYATRALMPKEGMHAEAVNTARLDGWFGWLTSIWEISDNELLKVAGTDALMLHLFMRFGLETFAMVSILTIGVALPVNWTASLGTTSLGTASTQDRSIDNDFQRLLFTNIPAGDRSGRLWAHFALVYVITVAVCWRLRSATDRAFVLRQKYLRSGVSVSADKAILAAAPEKFTVLLTDLPHGAAELALVAPTFRALFPRDFWGFVPCLNTRWYDTTVSKLVARPLAPNADRLAEMADLQLDFLLKLASATSDIPHLIAPPAGATDSGDYPLGNLPAGSFSGRAATAAAESDAVPTTRLAEVIAQRRRHGEAGRALDRALQEERDAVDRAHGRREGSPSAAADIEMAATPTAAAPPRVRTLVAAPSVGGSGEAGGSDQASVSATAPPGALRQWARAQQQLSSPHTGMPPDPDGDVSIPKGGDDPPLRPSQAENGPGATARAKLFGKLLPAGMLVFRSPMAARAAAATFFMDDGRFWKTEMAPAPGNLAWSALRFAPIERWRRGTLFRSLFRLFTVVALLPITLISGLSYLTQLQENGALSGIPSSKLLTILTGYIPGLLLVLFYAVVCWRVIYWLCREEGVMKSLGELDNRVGFAFYYFLVWNVFIGNVIAGTIFSQLGIAITNPSSLLTLASRGITASSAFFLKYILTQTGTQSAAALLCLGRLLGYFITAFDNCMTNGPRGIGARPFRPQSTMFGIQLGYHGLSFLIGFVYSTLNPLIPLVVLGHFLVSIMVWKFKVVYTNVRAYESGGLLWSYGAPTVGTALVTYHVVMALIFGLENSSEGYLRCFLLIPAILLVLAFSAVEASRMGRSFLELPPKPDDAVQAEGELLLAVARSYLHPSVDPQKGYVSEAGEAWMGYGLGT